MKKQFLALAAAAVMAVSLVGCGSSKTETTAATEASGDATTAAEKTSGDATTAAEKADDKADAAEGSEESKEAEAGATGGKLIMATNAEFPPYEFHDNGQIVGIDAEIAAAIAEKLGMELQIEDMAFDSIIPAIQSGKAHIGAAGMTVNEDRLKNIDFTDTYAESAQVIIVKEGSDITSPDNLSGKKIGVQLGTTGDIYADDLEDTEVERYSKGMEAVQALMQDKIDAVIIDREPAKVFVKENEGLKILDEAFTEEEYAIAVKKGNTELVEKINGALKELKESGELQKIVDKYISAN